MGEIIAEWISKRLGTVLDLKKKNFVDYLKGGKLLAQLLNSYGVIDKETYEMFEPTEDKSKLTENYSKICLWLLSIGIECDRATLEKIVCDSCNISAIKLFYQLYLVLHDKDKIHFVVQSYAKKLDESDEEKCQAGVEEEEEIFKEGIEEGFKLEPCAAFTEQADILQWQKNRYKELLDRYKDTREKYLNHILNLCGKQEAVVAKVGQTSDDRDEKEEIKALPIQIDSSISGYSALIEEQKKAEGIEIKPPDPAISSAIVKKLRDKRRYRSRQKELQVQMQKMLLHELWEKMISDQEKALEENLQNVLLKQSKYEQQMATKMSEVNDQKGQIVDSKRKSKKKEQKKVEEEVEYEGFIENKMDDDKIRNYYEERDRLLELHRRLYAERMALRAERHYNMSQDIMRDILTMVFRLSEFQHTYETEVPQQLRDDLARLFVKEQPIYDMLENVDDIIQDYFSEGTIEEGSERISDESSEILFDSETVRQDYLDEKDFENYHNLKWPWKPKELISGYGEEEDDDEEKMDTIKRGSNVLGHIVHWLVSAKCPKPLPTPPDIPKARPAACVNGLINPEEIVPLLQRLLQQRGIKVIVIQEAINYCLDAFKEETTLEYPEEILATETERTMDAKKDKGKGKGDKKKKGDKAIKSNKKKDKLKQAGEDQSAEDVPKAADKIVQTPKLFPCEELVLTKKGELGLQAHEILSTGEELPPCLIASMFVEYLKSLTSFAGWALINYPICFDEAAALEEALTAIPVPEQQRKDEEEEELDEYANLEQRPERELGPCDKEWRSRILPKPAPVKEVPFYETFLTGFIELKPFDPNEAEKEFDEDDPFGEKLLSDLETFYAKQGCYYTLTYKVLDFATTKDLAKLIVGDYTVPPKTSVEILGDTVLYLQDEYEAASKPGKKAKAKAVGKKEKPKKKEKVAPPKEDKGKGKGGKGGKGKGKDVVTTADKEVQVPEEEEEVEIIYEEPPPPPQPGQPEWEYVEINFPDIFKIALGTLWENAEEVYVCDFRELFFIQRVLTNSAYPYFAYIKNDIRSFISRPDDKQTHLTKFQKIFNEFDPDMRDDEEVKAELHCRIAEFKEKLLRICDSRMMEAEEERRKVMQNYWDGREACEITNIYVTALQLELDRCADTMSLLTDYYVAIITKMPYEEPPLAKDTLERVDSGTIDTPSEIVSDLYEFIAQDITNSTDAANPLFVFLEKVYGSACNSVTKHTKYAKGAITKLSGFFKKGKGKGAKSPKKQKPKKGDAGGKLPAFTEPDQEVKDASDKILQEWNFAVAAETERINFRLELILQRGKNRITELLQYAYDVYGGLYEEIMEKYDKEIEGVEKACQFLSQAVEAEMSIQPMMRFEDDKFVIDPNVVLFPYPLPPPEPPIEEAEQDAVFKITQLKTIVDILFEVAPGGLLPERTFIYLLQDMITLKVEDGSEPMVPPLWRKLQPKQVEDLSKALFGNAEFVNWKDFIVLNLELPFPTEKQLLDVRSSFRENDPDATETVKDYQYNDVEFWFEFLFKREENEQQILRLNLIKDILYKMYMINEDTINYTALLLAFCKDENPVVGLAKAFELSLGKMVCWDPKVGQQFIAYWEEKKRQEEEEEAEKEADHEFAIKTAEDILADLTDKTVHVCDSVVIEELPSVAETAFPTTDVFEDEEEEEEEEEECEEQGDEECLCAYKCSSIFAEEFSNVEIGFETTGLPPLNYLLPFELIMVVVMAALPWYSKVQNLKKQSLRQKLQKLYCTLRKQQFHDVILFHEFLNSDDFYRLLPSISSQFRSVSPAKIVSTLVNCGSL